MLESLFNKYAELKAHNSVTKRLQRRCFPVKFIKFLRTPFSQNIPGGCFWKYFIIALFIAFEDDEGCHFLERIGSPALISFYYVFKPGLVQFGENLSYILSPLVS